MGVLRFFLAVAACFLAACAGGVIDTSRTFKTVVIDAGHGGYDSGATTRYAGKEKNLALGVAQRLQPKLEAAGFQTVMTRTGDSYIPLDTRARISNGQVNSIFVSVHFNYSPNRAIHGAEVYYKSRSSAKIAERVLAQITALPGVSSRGVKTANFRVLKKNRYPAILVECGFLTNPSEGMRCASGAYQEALAMAIARGILIQRFGGERMVAAQ